MVYFVAKADKAKQRLRKFIATKRFVIVYLKGLNEFFLISAAKIRGASTFGTMTLGRTVFRIMTLRRKNIQNNDTG